jgi:hypothetical protein
MLELKLALRYARYVLAALATVSANDVWAVGTFGTTGNVDNRTLTETYPCKTEGL